MSTGTTSNDRFKQYLEEALSIISRNCESYHQNYPPDYRVVASQLRIILCDKNRNQENSLVLKVIPNVKLHPLTSTISKEELDAKPYVWLAGRITGIPIRMRIVDCFNVNAVTIPLEEWRMQIAAISNGKPHSIMDIIKSVAEKDGGTHIDVGSNEYLDIAGTFTHTGPSGRTTTHKQAIIIAIGEYIAAELSKQIQGLSDQE